MPDHCVFRAEPLEVAGPELMLTSTLPNRIVRHFHTASALEDVGLVFVGGEECQEPVSVVYERSRDYEYWAMHRLSLKTRLAPLEMAYSTVEFQDQSMADRLLRRSRHSAQVWTRQDGKRFIILFGGQADDESVLGDTVALAMRVDRSRPTRHVLAQLREMTTKGCAPCPRMQHASAIVRDALLVFGGAVPGGQALDDLFVLALDSLVWRRLDLPGGLRVDARLGASLCAVDCRNTFALVGGMGSRGRKCHAAGLLLLRVGSDDRFSKYSRDDAVSWLYESSDAFADLLLMTTDLQAVPAHRFVVLPKFGSELDLHLESDGLWRVHTDLSLLAVQLLLEWAYEGYVTRPLGSADEVNAALGELLLFAASARAHWSLEARVLQLLHGRIRHLNTLGYATEAPALRFTQVGMLYTDVTLRALSDDGVEILLAAHRAVLCHASLFFRGLLDSPFSEASSSVVDLGAVPDEEALVLALRWMYNEADYEPPADPNLALRLLPVAHRWDLRLLLVRLEKLVIGFLDASCASFVWQVARLYDISSLKMHCASYCLAHFDEVRQSAHFQSLDADEQLLLTPLKGRG